MRFVRVLVIERYEIIISNADDESRRRPGCLQHARLSAHSERKGPHFGNRIKRKYGERIYSTRITSIDLRFERELRGRARARARAAVPHRIFTLISSLEKGMSHRAGPPI